MYVENPVTALSYLNIFCLPEAGYFLWFLWALWWMFCIVPFFKTKKSRFALFIIAVVLHLLSPVFSFPALFCIKETANMMIWFMLGVECHDLGIYLKKSKFAYVCITFVGFIVALLINGTLSFPFFMGHDMLMRSYGGVYC